MSPARTSCIICGPAINCCSSSGGSDGIASEKSETSKCEYLQAKIKICYHHKKDGQKKALKTKTRFSQAMSTVNQCTTSIWDNQHREAKTADETEAVVLIDTASG